MTNQKIKIHFQRFEFKYQMPSEVIEGILPELLKYMDIDPFASSRPNHSYRVSSLYYDSGDYDSYYEKVAGIRSRKKLRIRFYENTKETDKVFLEIKRKYDMVVIKDRVTLKREETRKCIEHHKIPEDIPDEQRETLMEFLAIKLKKGMLPQVMVIYDRKPMMSKIDQDFRITIDSNIRTYPAEWINSKGIERLVDNNRAILEVKFNNMLPKWFHRIIQANNLEQRPYSKYGNCLEVVHPSLGLREMTEVYNPSFSFA